MTRPGIFPGIIFSVLLLTGLAGCGNSSQRPAANSPDTSVTTGAPDNNSANNPSLADTSYEKNRTRPITDTMKQDTIHRKKR